MIIQESYRCEYQEMRSKSSPRQTINDVFPGYESLCNYNRINND